MPPQGDQFSNTPFARVLTAFMWSKTPPWSAAKTAAVLGIHRARVANWVYKGIVPELDTILVVMAKLGIPVRFLIDAYSADGIPVPPLDVDEAQVAEVERQRVAQLGEAASHYYQVPPARRGRGGGVGRSTGQTSAQQVKSATAPEVSNPPNVTQDESDAQQALQRQQAQQDEWETMIAHTREVMTAAGMPDAALDALLTHLARTREGQPTEAQRRIAEEYAVSQDASGSTPGIRQPSAPASDPSSGSATPRRSPHSRRTP